MITSSRKQSPSGGVELPRSGWAAFFLFLGFLSLFAAFVIWFDVADGVGSALTGWICLAAALQMFFASFLVNVFTDIRWYLRALVMRDSKNSESFIDKDQA